MPVYNVAFTPEDHGVLIAEIIGDYEKFGGERQREEVLKHLRELQDEQLPRVWEEVVSFITDADGWTINDVKTLKEAFKQRGYATPAFVID